MELKDAINNMIIIKPLKSHFSIEKELKNIQDRTIGLQQLLMIRSNQPIEIKESEKPKVINASKILKNLQRKNKIAGLNSIGSSVLRKKIMTQQFEQMKESASLNSDAVAFTQDVVMGSVLDMFRYLRGYTSYDEYNKNLKKHIKRIGDVKNGIENLESHNSKINLLKSYFNVLFGGSIDLGYGAKTLDGGGVFSFTQFATDEPFKKSKTAQIQSILDAGADFLKNFFEVSFVFRDRTTPERFETIMYTRTGSIEIPRLKAKTFTIKTINGSVEKIASQLQGTYETNLDLRIDQDCYILDKFSEIGGIWQFNRPKIYPASSIFIGDNININREHRLDIVIKEISGFEHRRLSGVPYLDNQNVNHMKDIYNHLLKSRYNENIVNTPDVTLNESKVSEWVLEDVRIVGISDINYSFDQMSPPNVSIQLTMKSVFHRTANI